MRHERHCGSVVLDATVPQMGRKMVEVPLNCLMVSDWMVEEAAFQETPEVKLHLKFGLEALLLSFHRTEYSCAPPTKL